MKIEIRLIFADLSTEQNQIPDALALAKQREAAELLEKIQKYGMFDDTGEWLE